MYSQIKIIYYSKDLWSRISSHKRGLNSSEQLTHEGPQKVCNNKKSSFYLGRELCHRRLKYKSTPCIETRFLVTAVIEKMTKTCRH